MSTQTRGAGMFGERQQCVGECRWFLASSADVKHPALAAPSSLPPKTTSTTISLSVPRSQPPPTPSVDLHLPCTHAHLTHHHGSHGGQHGRRRHGGAEADRRADGTADHRR